MKDNESFELFINEGTAAMFLKSGNMATHITNLNLSQLEDLAATVLGALNRLELDYFNEGHNEIDT